MHTKTINLPQYRHLFLILCAISLVSLVVYIYGINQTVRNVVERGAIEKQLTKIRAQNSEREFAYITEKNTIDMNRAATLGFTPVNQEVFVSRQSQSIVAFDDVSLAH